MHLSDVLDHIPDPREMLSTVYELLEPGTVACIFVPNDYNPFREALLQAAAFESSWVAPPHHLNYFDLEIIAHLVARSGFEVFLRKRSFSMELLLDNPGARGKKREFYRALAAFDLGCEVGLFARKRS